MIQREAEYTVDTSAEQTVVDTSSTDDLGVRDRRKEIRGMLLTGRHTRRDLAEHFHVDVSIISRDLRALSTSEPRLPVLMIVEQTRICRFTANWDDVFDDE